MVSHLFASLVIAGSAVCPAGTPVPAESVLREVDFERLYRAGVPFEQFYADVERRKALWVSHYTEGGVDPELVSRLAALPGRWRILAVAVDACSDSANTIPYLALLADRLENVEMRLIDSDTGRELMESHRTPDGRPATPTVVLLDERFREVGCWIERPAELQAWALDAGSRLETEAFMSRKMSWYRDDAGRSTVREIAAMFEAAVRGEPICG